VALEAVLTAEAVGNADLRRWLHVYAHPRLTPNNATAVVPGALERAMKRGLPAPVNHLVDTKQAAETLTREACHYSDSEGMQEQNVESLSYT
jgi:hypothetical protein